MIESLPPGTHIVDRCKDWTDYLNERCKDKIRKIEREYPKFRDLYIDWTDVLSYGTFGSQMSDEILYSPDKAISDILDAVMSIIRLKKKGVEPVNIRIVNTIRKTAIRDLRSHHLKQFISLEGIVRKITEVRPRITMAVYRCRSGHATRVICGYGQMQEPDTCSVDGCQQRKFNLQLNMCDTVDSQKIRVQESPEGLRGGEQPQVLDIDLTDTLCGLVNPGDRITLNGIIRGIQRTSSGQKSSTIDIYLECNSIEVSEKEFSEVTYSDDDIDQIKALAATENIHAIVSQSIAPSIFGAELLKTAIAFQMFGGVAKNHPDGSRLRGDIHVLIIGDPGIAKSQILRYVSIIAPRAILTSGQSASKAGLTATAVNDEFGEGRWTLEAGALVLADMGIACVDEIDKMDKNDRSALHEAMEQQVVSLAKAGITATLKTRCALLGAANPKYGRFNSDLELSQQIEMGAALLSRFDIIILATDVPDPARDRAIAQHVTKTHQIGEALAQYEAGMIRNRPDISSIKPPIDPDLFRKYVAYAKKNVIPKMNREAKNAIDNHYCTLRGLGGENKPVPVTVRLEEALVRLAEASAKIRLSNEVSLFDAQLAIDLLDSCLKGIAYDPVTGIWDVDAVEVGKKKSNQNLSIAIKQAIEQIADENGRAKLDTVISMLGKTPEERHAAEMEVERMTRAGDIMAPKHGLVKLV